MRALQKLGYANVKEYKGGKKEWLEANLPVESTRPVGLLERLEDFFS